MRKFFVFTFVFLFFFPKIIFAQMSAATRASLAANEIGYLTPIYNNLIGNVSNFSSVYSPELDANIWNHNLYYRTLCSLVIIEAMVKGKQLKVSDPALNYFISKYNAYDFASTFNPINPTPTPTPNGQDFHRFAGASVAANYCFYAANVSRDVLPEWNYNSILIEYKNIVIRMHALGEWVAYAKSHWIDRTDSSAEEVSQVATLFLAAAEYLPSAGPGSITSAERQAYYTQGKNLVSYLLSQCSAGWPFLSGKWLVTNHWLEPNPNYTLSYLTSFSEIGMLYTQQGKALPADIFTPSVTSVISQVGSALQPYINNKFQFTGAFSIVNSLGQSLTSYDFANTRYSMNSSDTYPLHSSIPVDRVDSWNQFYLYNSKLLKSYIYRDGKTWHYTCDNSVTPTDCKAEHQTTPLSNLWSIIGDRQVWQNTTPGEKVDAQTQWYQPNANGIKQDKLITKIFSGDKVWEYTCIPGSGCNATGYQALSSFFPQGAWDIAPPTTGVDTVSQWIKPQTQELRTYVTRGNLMWDFRCTNMSLYPTGHTCTIGSVTDIASRWVPINQQTWAAAGWEKQNVPPTSDLDAFNQSYNAEETVQTTYIIKGNRIWQYACGAGCNAITTRTLSEQFRGVRDQFKWPFESYQSDFQNTGVSDWGHDATIQNSAYSALAYFNPAYVSYYQALQAEQDARGRKQHGPFPEQFVNGHWQYGPVQQTYADGVVITHLMDGMQAMNWNTRTIDFTERIATNRDKSNSHWWFNMLAGLNHSMAYLFLTDTKLLSPFVYPRVTPTLTPTPIACLAPPILSAVSQGACTTNAIPVTFSWSSVAGATGYYFRLSKPGGGVVCDAGAYCPAPIGATSFTTSVTPGQTYDWWVHTANNCSAGAGTYNVGRFTANPCPSNTPVPLPGDFVKNNSVDYADLNYVRLSVQAGLLSIFDFSTVIANYGRSQ